MSKGCYLIHIEPAYKHAAHYLGWSKDIDARVASHLAGTGGRLTKVALAAGCTLTLVRVWPDTDRAFERKLKRQKNSPYHCPICKGVNNHD